MSSARYDVTQFAGRKNLPIGAQFDGHEFRGRGISYEDYSRMGTVTRKGWSIQSRRTLPTERLWALDDAKVRAVLVRTLEIRAGLRKPQTGTDSERLARAQKAIQERVCPSLKVTLNGMCGRYALMRKMGVPPSELESLEKTIKGADTALRIASQIPAITVGIIYRYFRLGDDSVAVADALGITPVHVRKIIFNLENCAGELGYVKRANLPKRDYRLLSEEERERRARLKLAHREECDRLKLAQREERIRRRGRRREEYERVRRERYQEARARGATREEANRARRNPNRRARISLIEPTLVANRGRLAHVDIKRLHSAGHSLRAIARMYGVHPSSVSERLQRADAVAQK